jgi:hypothetical protein
MTQDSAVFLRAIRGPVMMITIGVLFALDNLTPFSFNRTWPVLLVVAGILNLGRRPAIRAKIRYPQWTPPQPPSPPTPPYTPDPWSPSGTSTSGPGSYRGSNYESTPGNPAPRSAENKENREKPAASTPSDPGGVR